MRGKYKYAVSIEVEEGVPVVFEWEKGEKLDKTTYGKSEKYYSVNDILFSLTRPRSEFLKLAPREVRRKFNPPDNKFLEWFLEELELTEIGFGWRIDSIIPNTGDGKSGSVIFRFIIMAKNGTTIPFDVTRKKSRQELHEWMVFARAGTRMSFMLPLIQWEMDFIVLTLTRGAKIQKTIYKQILKKGVKTAIINAKKQFVKVFKSEIRRKWRNAQWLRKPVKEFCVELSKNIIQQEIQLDSLSSIDPDLQNKFATNYKIAIYTALEIFIEKLIDVGFEDFMARRGIPGLKFKIDDIDPLFIPEIKERLQNYMKAVLYKFILLDWQKHLVKYFNKEFWESIKNDSQPDPEKLGGELAENVIKESLGSLVEVLMKLLDEFEFHINPAG